MTITHGSLSACDISKLRQCCVVVRVKGNDISTASNYGSSSSSSALKSNKSSSSQVPTFSHSSEGKITFSCSGFIINREQGIILTSSSIFMPFLSRRNEQAHYEIHRDTEIDIMCNNNRQIKEEDIKSSNSGGSGGSGSGQSIYNKSSDERIYDPLKDWIQCRFHQLIEVDQSIMDIVDLLKSYFVIGSSKSLSLVLLKASSPLTVDPAIDQVRFAQSTHIKTGERISIVASPFGFISPTIFLNSVSSGIICNKIAARPYSHPSLFLTDARCLPGSEGAAVFNSRGEVIAIVTPPIRAKDEKTPFNLASLLPTHTFLEYLLKTDLVAKPLISNSVLSLSPLQTSLSLLDRQKHNIVLVKFKDTWGSGVLISSNGYILTNAHILAPSISALHKASNDSNNAVGYPAHMFKDYRVEIRVDYAALIGKETIGGHMWYNGRIEYISHTHLDIALLKIVCDDSLVFHHVECNTLLNVQHGTEVAVLGYPLLPPSQEPPVSVTHGIISNVVCVDGMAVSYQTTAPVHSGNSGGGLFDERGNFLGIVTCNAKQRNGSIITDLNFSIPATSLVHFFNYANGQDIQGLEIMIRSKTNKFLRALWKLQITSSPHSSSQNNINQKHLQPLQKQPPQTTGNGRKYAEFLEKITNTPQTSAANCNTENINSLMAKL
ncbi:hypothetical protein PPL_04362 [Heterostelium album PN500]|uniref:Peroxisomal leader peptide-processing protease n=1 Tax=Heterostelium pallidum (strain ATCC 26659 / Pp 5 / PN500) TaxID=670386 RepID=D3B7C5_HETP5|nr:hypothetical protein PPL_04362 [Heterostelium album PN500]EFA82668.1 hypothetical protein PPL_04362 [Heterostelium album PN500]|eukprot:XP_020434785.1 hypothetical protein PPL_04362 [Heterostelium album PN500]